MKTELLLAIALFGAVGAVSRVLLGTWIQAWCGNQFGLHFPMGTLVVNVVGCFAFGVLGCLGNQESLSPFWRTVLLSGLLGSLTTFSTFGYETYLLFNNASVGKLLLSGSNIILNVGVGLLAIILGVQMGRWMTGG